MLALEFKAIIILIGVLERLADRHEQEPLVDCLEDALENGIESLVLNQLFLSTHAALDWISECKINNFNRVKSLFRMLKATQAIQGMAAMNIISDDTKRRFDFGDPDFNSLRIFSGLSASALIGAFYFLGTCAKIYQIGNTISSPTVAFTSLAILSLLANISVIAPATVPDSSLDLLKIFVCSSTIAGVSVGLIHRNYKVIKNVFIS